MRASSTSTRDAQSIVLPASHPLEAIRRQAGPTNNSSPALPTSGANLAVEPQHTVRPAASLAAFAPEPVTDAQTAQLAPTINCNRCGAARIQHDLHYHCPRCRNGTFNMCQPCYREGQGCDHWYSFGFKAEERYYANAPPSGWPAAYERPHLLTARRFPKPGIHIIAPTGTAAQLQKEEEEEEEGAFCESCASPANDCYWYCLYCLEGAWGYCDRCVRQGRHCTHPLLPVAQHHLSTQQQPQQPPFVATFVPMPHLKPESYVLWAVTTDCDICSRQIAPNSSRFHCLACSGGDYDVCTECYHTLVATGKIREADGPDGWRRCLAGHRMAVVGFRDVQYGGQQRVVVREPVGGWRHGEGGGSVAARPGLSSSSAAAVEQKGPGSRCRAMYNYFPRNGGEDDLAFPKNAEIGEVREETAEWFSGVYCGRLGLFPASHVRKL
ncbi:hypothetical protein B0A55_11373 [Friedmanniomyces simplex]|uniref:SH3 domain-containing protein n=1 Tax=Friedmanniomyces simplex TaxID=329884 RepID=A0A4U0WP89_9PEZI|nr:hypothetical protein B0A55_11373 [Friedmanniomyces simplex]